MTLARVLVIAFVSTSLVLPTGWCCWLPAVVAAHLPARAVEKSTPTPAPAPCCCCEPQTTETAGTTDPTAPREAPPVPIKCCCEAQASLLPKPIEKTSPPAFVFALPVLAVAPPAVVVDVVAPCAGDIVSPPLHLLHSVWLC